MAVPLEAAIARIGRVAGEVFNIGGGPANTLSIWAETGAMLEALFGRHIPVEWADWRPGDQRICVMDVRKVSAVLDWSPKVTPDEGVRRLYEWVVENRRLFSDQ